MHEGSVSLHVSGALRTDLDAESGEAITLFHHGPEGQSSETSLTLSLLSDGSIRAIHRCEGDLFELRGGRVPADGLVVVTYAWGPDGSCLFVNGALADDSLAVLSLPPAPVDRFSLHLDLQDDRLISSDPARMLAERFVPTDMSM
ncbi:MAG: hypothetical protein AAFV19_25110 [Pseudomonadota bacterium]